MMAAVFFVYGLAFFCMGLIILVYPRKHSDFRLAHDLDLLAAFSLIHGVTEWMDMVKTASPEVEPALAVARHVALITSFGLLGAFGLRCAARAKGWGGS